MVATRSPIHVVQPSGEETDLRPVVRDLIALSSLQMIWSRADARQIADGLGQLSVSMMDTDFACVKLEGPAVEVVHFDDRDVRPAFPEGFFKDYCRAVSVTTAEIPGFGQMRAISVPIGSEPGSALMCFSRRETFPTETEHMLARVAANHAAVALQRWRDEQALQERSRQLESQSESNAALFKFTDALYRSTSLDDVINAGLDAIVSAFGCRRASILLFDAENVARFVGWRDLSDQYRAAVEGHCPWAAGERDARPIFVTDISATGESDALKATIRAEGISALAFIPIMANGGVIGKFMTYHETPHDFSGAESALAVTIARQLGFSIERRRAEQERDEAQSELRARKELRRSEERFRILVEGVTDYAIYMLDHQGHVTNWNTGAHRIKQYTADEIVGQHFSRFYTEEDRANGEPERALSTARAEGRFEKEGWRVRKDGTRFWAHVVLDPIRSDDGEIVGFAKITRDITERRDAQRALETAREAFFQSQKMEAIGQLTGGVAHDFNNLLAAVLGGLHLLRKRLPDDAKALGLLDNAVQAAKRGAALTQRMLAFARRQDLNIEPINLPDLVNGIADLLQTTIGPTVELRIDCPSHLPPALADSNQLELAVLNLVVNARDAMPQGGAIRIVGRVTTAEDKNFLPPNDYICLSVSDNGEGMDEATLQRATEPFFTTKGVGKGTGLGLSMVQGLAAQLGGRVRLESVKGQGTNVELWLPLAHTAAFERARPQLNETSGRADRTCTILAVDDDALVLMNTVAMLEDMGHRVLEAASAARALEVLQKDRVDLVLTDQAMPRMTGLELAQQIRARWPALPVVIATGYAELPANALALQKLAKPFDQRDLQRAITEALRPIA
jgi:PAS domain S-box-containing protein